MSFKLLLVSQRNMKKILILIVAVAMILLFPLKVDAAEKQAGQSAGLVQASAESIDDQMRATAIKNVLTRYKSPMVGEAENFIIVANAMDLDPYMLPAIAGVESGFGNALIQGSNNPFGWNVGRTPFPTWSDGIATVGYALRHKYIDRGAESLDAIGHRYAGGSTTWAPKVVGYIAMFEKEEAKVRRYSVL